MILAIETSCDETSVAVICDGKIVSNELFSQIKHHASFGGVVPELASRLHAEYIDLILDKALTAAQVDLNQIRHIAVTAGPGLEGALLVGIMAARSLGQLLNIPVIGVNHLHGHIFAAMQEADIQYPALVCIASGGHTMLIRMDHPVDFSILANTMDDACGEAFDKVARMLDLGYPGGPKVEALALKGQVNVDLPHPVYHQDDAFSFSGLKTAVLQVIQSNQNKKEDIASSFQHRVATILAHKINRHMAQFTPKQVILCGGVFANQAIRSYLFNQLESVDVVVPSLNLCTDNAGMIGLAASVYLKHQQVGPFVCSPQLGLRFLNHAY